MSRARGFTLLEIMLAFVLLAGAMGLLIGMLSGGLRQVSDGRSETEAALYAQSFLAELGVLDPIRPGHSNGAFADGRYRYTLTIQEAGDPAAPPSMPGQLAGAETGKVSLPVGSGERQPVLYRVILTVAWGAGGRGQSLEIRTLRYRIPALDESAR